MQRRDEGVEMTILMVEFHRLEEPRRQKQFLARREGILAKALVREETSGKGESDLAASLLRPF